MSILFELFETYYPSLSGLVITLATFYLLEKNIVLVEVFDKVLPSILTLCAVLIGFISATRAFLLSISENSIVLKLRATGSYKKLFRYHNDAIRCLFALLSYSLILIGVGAIKALSEIPVIIICFWIGILTMSIASCFRAIDIVSEIMNQID